MGMDKIENQMISVKRILNQIKGASSIRDREDQTRKPKGKAIYPVVTKQSIIYIVSLIVSIISLYGIIPPYNYVVSSVIMLCASIYMGVAIYKNLSFWRQRENHLYRQEGSKNNGVQPVHSESPSEKRFNACHTPWATSVEIPDDQPPESIGEPTTFDLSDPKHQMCPSILRYDPSVGPHAIMPVEPPPEPSPEEISSMMRSVAEDDYNHEPYCWDIDGLKQNPDQPKFAFKMDNEYIETESPHCATNREAVLRRIKEYDAKLASEDIPETMSSVKSSDHIFESDPEGPPVADLAKECATGGIVPGTTDPDDIILPMMSTGSFVPRKQYEEYMKNMPTFAERMKTNNIVSVIKEDCFAHHLQTKEGQEHIKSIIKGKD